MMVQKEHWYGQPRPRSALDSDPETVVARQETLLRAATGLDYELLEQLGRGASGSVWRARDLALSRELSADMEFTLGATDGLPVLNWHFGVAYALLSAPKYVPPPPSNYGNY